MIRVNFLPVKEKRRAEEVRLWLLLSGVILLAEIIVLVAMHFHFLGKIKELDLKETKIRQQIKEVEAKVKEVQDVDKKKKEVDSKLKIIEALGEGRDLDVRLLDELAKSVPFNPEARIKKRLQIKGFSKKGGTVTIKGISMDQESIAVFIGNLEKSEYYRGVTLKGVTAKKEKGISYFEFDLEASVEETAPGRRGG